MALAIGVAVVVLLKPAQATFPGVPGKIAYVGGDEIHTIWPGGSGDRQITTDTPRGARAPAYSPDGSRIAYDRPEEAKFPLDSEIYTVKASDGSGKLQLTHSTKPDYSPSYSPDGRRIAYVSSDGNDPEIYTIRTDGQDRRQVTNNSTRDVSPSWGSR